MRIIKTNNPLTLADDHQAIIATSGITPNKVIRENGLVFTRPFFLLANGAPVMRKDWDKPLPKDMICHFVELPRGSDSNPLQLLATFAVIVLSVYTGGLAAAAWGTTWGAVVQGVVAIGGMMLVNMFFGGQMVAAGEIEQPETVYGLTNNRNRLRIGSPFVEHFGRFICYPDLAMGTYTQMEDNDQYLYFLGIIGIGKYDIEGVYIDKTPILDYTDTSYNILAPGTTPTICPDIVWTCPEISNQELTTAWITVAVSAAGTQTMELGFDIVFPSGLIGYNDDAEKIYAKASAAVEARLINSKGVGLQAWVNIFSKEYNERSKDPLRYSIKVGVPYGPGRYEVRIKRGEEKSESSKIANAISIGNVRSYGVSHPDYGDITMVECKIKATDQLNGDAAGKINVIAIRKLKEVTAVGFAGTETASRSIVDACAYIVSCDNGGKQADAIIDFETLTTLRTSLETAENYFDWRFTNRLSVMEACSRVAKCGRSIPYMPSGKFALVRDQLQPIPAQVYTENDYSEGAFEMDHTIRTEDSPTCVKIEYVDPDTWQSESIICLDLGGSEDNPAVVQLDGCTSRQHAYEEGMYMYKDDELNRTAVSFTTGLKGHIPSIGQKIVVSANMTDWGQSGLIADIDGGNIWLSEPVDFKEKEAGSLYITSATGGAAGPYIVEPTDYTHCITGAIPGDTKTQKVDGETATKFLFGPADIDLLNVRVVKIRPENNNRVRILGNIIHDEVYEDFGAAPGLPGFTGGELLESVFCNYAGMSGTDYKFLATWSGIATKFKVEHKSGAGSYVVDHVSLEAYQKEFTISEKDITVRITPYDSEDVLQPGDALTASYTMVGIPTGLELVGDVGASVTIQWDAVTGADSYDTALFYDSENMGTKTVTGTSVTITETEIIQMGGPWQSFVAKVYANKGSDQGLPASLGINALVPAAVTGLMEQSRGVTSVVLSWDSVPNTTGYKVYQGATIDFDPAATGTLVCSGTETNCTVTGLTLSGDYEYFFKAAGISLYFTEPADLNFSDALVVSPEIGLLTEAGNYLMTESGHLIGG
jgi:hypothetical protein